MWWMCKKGLIIFETNREFRARVLRRLPVAVFAMLAVAPASAEIEVIETIEDGLLCRTVTFEGGGHFEQIALETGGFVPGSGLVFTDTWATAFGSLIGIPESPFGGVVGIFGFDGTDVGEVAFTDPVARVDLLYFSAHGVLFEAFDSGSNLVASAFGPVNTTVVPLEWDPIELDTEPQLRNVIGRVTLTGGVFATVIDGLRACQSGPFTSDVEAEPNPASINEMITLSATIDDLTGANTIVSANFEIRDTNDTVVLSGTGDDGVCPGPSSLCPLDANGDPDPVDPPFDSTTEEVAVTIPSGILNSRVYDACVRGSNSLGHTGPFACIMLPVYDPDGSFVTGQGWIQSDPGFCSLNQVCMTADGRAFFALVSKYQSGASVPRGQTNFRFHSGDLRFKSIDYDWLVVAGPMAQFKGTGTINGGGDYGFLLTAKDSALNGGPPQDTFRIKIWDKASELAVYDNGSNQPLGAGDIRIHK